MTRAEDQTAGQSCVVAGRRLCVVLVDDNPATVRLCSHVFGEAGWRVHAFTSPVEALALLPQIEPDLIVTDYRMPEMSGPEFLLEAQRFHEAVPKLVMTAFDDDPQIQETLRHAGLPSVSKLKGITEVVAIADQLTAIRRAVKSRTASASGE